MIKSTTPSSKQTNEYPMKSVAERELHLWQAASLYMSGKISIKDLENVERSDDPDLKKAVLALAKQKLEQRFKLTLYKLRNLFNNRKAPVSHE